MKKELFYRIIEVVTALYNKDTGDKNTREIKISNTEECIIYHFNDIGYNFAQTRDNVAKAKDIFKEHGYKSDDVYEMITKMSGNTRLVRETLSILYNKVKDKISISTFSFGYDLAARKGRFYPLKKNNPVLCYSKHLYNFAHLGGRGMKRSISPRIMKGAFLPITYGREIMEIILGIKYTPNIQVVTRLYRGTDNEYQLVERIHDVKIPKALFVYGPAELDTLYSVLQDKGEVNKICQYLAKQPKEEVAISTERDKDFTSFFMHDSKTLFITLTDMMLPDKNNHYLIKDWIEDHKELGRKLTLKVKSKTRIEDEHRKMSKERMIKGIKAVKVHERYNDLFKDSELEFELIQDKARLLAESIDQDHCVATYANQINSGSCAIFSFKWEDKVYTLQVSSQYFNVQFRGHRNTDVPVELVGLVDKYLLEYRRAHQVTEKEFEALPF